MSYLVFDLDETLADLTFIYHFLMSLRVKEHILETQPYMIYFFPTKLEEQLELTYQTFVERILQEELSGPLGILRPGILQKMKEIAELKRNGIVKGVVIYSNNSHLPSLHFVRDIIELHTGPLFDDCIHWLHPSREDDRVNTFIMKSWSTLLRILHEGPTKAPANLSPASVYFFDDLGHTDLMMELKEQYYKVPAFHSTTSVDRISEIYAEVLSQSQIPMHHLLIYLVDLFDVQSTARYQPEEGTLDTVLMTIRALIPSKPYAHRPAHDYGIQMIGDVINEQNTQRMPSNQRKRRRRYTRRERRITIKKRAYK
jgi:hypothetical protein